MREIRSQQWATGVRFLGVVALLSGAALRAQAREVVEHHESGAVSARYKVDAEGRRNGLYRSYREDGSLQLKASYRKGELNGRYEELHPNGKRKLLATYRAGKLDGAYVASRPDGKRRVVAAYKKGARKGVYKEFHEDGSPAITARYRKGTLHGKRVVRSDDGRKVLTEHYQNGLRHGERKREIWGKVSCSQTWTEGRIATIDGVVPYPREKAALSKELVQIMGDQKGKPKAPLADQRAMALRRLQAYRHLCSLPWKEMTLDEEFNDRCQAAAEILERLGRLDHHPPFPGGMPLDRYEYGRVGTASSNLASAPFLAQTIDQYMDDSDPTNRERVGHRLWCLNPPMARTGFGYVGRWSAMWAFDRSGDTGAPREFVAFPPPGYVPRDLFKSHYMWSISFLKRKIDPVIRVQRLDDTWMPVGLPLGLEHSYLRKDGPVGHTAIFKPYKASFRAGTRYRVTAGEGGDKPPTVTFVVEFTDPLPDASQR